MPQHPGVAISDSDLLALHVHHRHRRGGRGVLDVEPALVGRQPQQALVVEGHCALRRNDDLVLERERVGVPHLDHVRALSALAARVVAGGDDEFVRLGVDDILAGEAAAHHAEILAGVGVHDVQLAVGDVVDRHVADVDAILRGERRGDADGFGGKVGQRAGRQAQPYSSSDARRGGGTRRIGCHYFPPEDGRACPPSANEVTTGVPCRATAALRPARPGAESTRPGSGQHITAR